MEKLVNITLVDQAETVSDIGEPVVVETNIPIRGRLSSVTREEWFSAYKADFNAKHRVRVYDFEYHNETVAILDGVRYAIYRTYYTGGQFVELYLGQKGGV